MNESRYLYSNTSADAGARLSALEVIEDPSSQAFLQRVSLPKAAAVLEVGAGAGSMARWFANYGGDQCQVLATDLAPVFESTGPVTVIRHNVADEALPESRFDLIHVRHVLFHLARDQQPAVINKFAGALKPGGRLVVEESDLSTWRASSSTPLQTRRDFSGGVSAVLAEYRQRGLDVSLGAGLFAMLDPRRWRLDAQRRVSRRVRGDTFEARYQQLTTETLALSAAGIRRLRLLRLAATFDDDHLVYRSRTTCQLLATKR